MKRYRVGVVGALRAVVEMLRILEERDFPIEKLEHLMSGKCR